MTVNFMWFWMQCPDKILFWVSQWRVFLKETNIWINELSRLPSLMWVGSIQSTESLNRTKSRRIRSFSPASCLIWNISISFLWTGIHPICSPGPQAFELSLNYSMGFPESPVRRRQIMGLLSFHNHINQFPQINVSIANSWFRCYSEEHWLIQIYYK